MFNARYVHLIHHLLLTTYYLSTYYFTHHLLLGTYYSLLTTHLPTPYYILLNLDCQLHTATTHCPLPTTQSLLQAGARRVRKPSDVHARELLLRLLGRVLPERTLAVCVGPR